MEDVAMQGDNAPQPAANPPPRKVKKQAPQTTINQFWDAFVSKFPGGVESVLPSHFYTKEKNLNPKLKSRSAASHAIGKSYDQAVIECKAAVAKIAKECRRINTKYRDPHFDIEIDLKDGTRNCLDGLVSNDWTMYPKAVKRVGDIFEAPVFFEEGASAGDIRQGSNGDCWFLSALTALTTKKDLIDNICVARDEKVGVYGFVFHRDGEWIQTIIDDKLYLTHADWDEIGEEKWSSWLQINRDDAEEEYRKANQVGSRALYFAQCRSENETWLPLIEKAYAKAHGDFNAIQGGFTGEGIEDLTGGVTTEILTSDILDTDLFWKEEIMKVNDEFLFGCATGLFDSWQGTWVDNDRKDIVAAHAYSILEAREVKGERLLKLRNPWGRMEWKGAWSDGSEQWTPEWMQLLDHRFGDDGVFWISYKDLLTKFQNFDRTRLFGPEWSVIQQWTSVDVPWAADYNDTKFTITVTKDTPIVIVLSKLDDRYFQGFEGQYDFSLHFRLDCEGDDDYLVRSHGTYFMGRAVSVDLDIEPGTYSVLIRITAKRNMDKETPDQVIKNTCKDCQEKLIQTGLAYDLAQAKGTYKESEAEKKLREGREARKKAAAHKKKKAELRENELKRWDIGRKRAQRNRRHEAAKVRHDERRAARLARERAEEEANEAEKGEKANDADDEEDVEKPIKDDRREGETSEPKNEDAKATESKNDEAEPEDTKVAETKVDETPVEGSKADQTKKEDGKEAESEDPKGSSSSDDAPVMVTPPGQESPESNNKSSEEPPTETDKPAEPGKPSGAEKSTGLEEIAKPEAAPDSQPSGEEQNALKEKPEGAAEISPEAPEPPKDEPSKTEEPAAELPSENEVPTSTAAQPRPAEEDNPDWAYDTDASFQSSIVTELDMAPDVEEPAKKPDAAAENPEDDDLKEWYDDPWNAVCTVGLRVYSKDPDLVIKVVRPRKLDDDDEEETLLDPDDINKTVAEEAIDGKSEEQLEERKKKDEEAWKEEKKEGGQEGTNGGGKKREEGEEKKEETKSEERSEERSEEKEIEEKSA